MSAFELSSNGDALPSLDVLTPLLLLPLKHMIGRPALRGMCAVPASAWQDCRGLVVGHPALAYHTRQADLLYALTLEAGPVVIP